MSGGPIAAVIVEAREVQVGDWIVLPHLGPREVVEVTEWVEETGRDPGPRVSIVYRMVGGGDSWENKASAHGLSSSGQLEGTVAPLRPDERVAVERELGGRPRP